MTQHSPKFMPEHTLSIEKEEDGLTDTAQILAMVRRNLGTLLLASYSPDFGQPFTVEEIQLAVDAYLSGEGHFAEEPDEAA
jgi:hypothetical protein